MLSAYSVTSTLDTVDASPGNGIAADAAGNATLRAAVMDANATAGADTITLGAGLFSLALAGRNENASGTGDLDVTGNLTIEGAGASQTILDAAQLDRFFHVLAGGTLTLRNVTIRNGRETNGGAIENDGTLNLENVDLTGNVTTTRGGALYNNTGTMTLQSVNVIGNRSSDVVSGVGTAIGGGLASFGGTVTIVGSQFASNTSAGDGGGIDSRSTVLQITNSTFRDNFATVGGAVRLFNGSAVLTNNTFNGDHATNSGGAIASNISALTISGGSFTGNYVSPVPPSGAARTGGSVNLVGVNAASPVVTITGVTFQQTGSGDGGAIYNSNIRLNLSNSAFDQVTGRQGGAINNNSGGTVVMFNTTITGATATLGSAILNSATVQMTNCTISGNSSTSGSAAVSNSGSFTSRNNLIAANVNGADVLGIFSSMGGNLIGQVTGGSGFGQSTDQVGTAGSPINPMLSPLANNGGNVPTMAISPRSPARDGGVSGGPAMDGRGKSRAADRTDAGAFEYENRLPVAGPFDVAGTEDVDYVGQLAATDEDDDTLTFELLVAPSTGVISVQANGQFRYTPPTNVFGSVGFRYRATDGRGVSNDVDAHILVTAVNDAPTFGDQDFTIDENSATGTHFGNLVATDIDSSHLTADIVSGNESGAFYLDPMTGELLVADSNQLNFEATPTFTLVVRVTDDGSPAGSTLATVTIHLTDVNDAPVLGQPTYAVDEMSADGTVVGLVPYTDEDAVQSYSYEIIGSDNPGAFTIDAASGEISVADGTLLDFETDASVLLLVRVTDQGSPTQVRDTVVTVNLNDVNDAPTIADQSFIIPENAEDGYFIGTISMFDVDSTLLSTVIVSGNDDGAIFLNFETGELFVTDSSQLNFEFNPTLTFVVRVTDDGMPARSNEATITIHLTDVNEAPVAESAEFAIDENSANGTVVGGVAASDVDVGQSLLFEIVDSTGAFAIDATTGLITVADGSALDFEGQASYALQIRVTDNGAPALSGDAVVVVTLNDVNDAPQLAGQSLSVPENSPVDTVVGTLTGTDQDASQTLTYSIVSGNSDGAFTIDPTTGQIVISNPDALNFETRQSFNLLVAATDDATPSLSTSALVTILLTDVNESPLISPAAFSLAENSDVGTTVGAASATDPDVGQTLTYSIVSGNTGGAFTIDPATGHIRVADALALNFEANSTFNLVVSVEDDGAPALSTTTTVTISLEDQNEAPAVDSSGFTVDENSADGTIVGTVVATDVDFGQTLTYEIVGAAGPFVIDASSGTITVADGSSLNFEGQSSFELVIRVTDNGSPSLSSDSVVVIDLHDVNDAPQMASQSFHVVDHAANGTPIGNMVATDEDAGQLLTYSIVSGNADGAFAIDPATGQIVVANSAAVNFLLTPVYSLTVAVTDNGSPNLSASAHAVVTIASAGTNAAPQIASQSFSLAENSENGAQVGVVVATDPDAGQTLRYSIVSGNTNDAFTINPETGRIVVANSAALNFEATPVFNLVVRVEDSGSPSLSSSATVSISLQNRNDAPQLEARSFTISENSAVGTVVGIITGTDQDAGQTLKYSITSGNSNGAFSINSETGKIKVANAEALNFESKASYSLTVKAMDNGSPSRYTTTIVTITVSDVNEKPQISEKSFSLDEKSANGVVVGSITASDPDAGQSLSYSIVSGNTNGAFAINAATGKITVANSAALVFATTPKFQLQVQVSDDGSPSLTNSATVTITLNPVLPYSSVVIDVGIGDSTNTIRLGKAFYVGILSSATFDARGIDVGKLRFGKLGTENSLVRTGRGEVVYCYRDVNRDGRLDLVIEVCASLTGLQPGDTTAKLTGKLRNGQPFLATSQVTVQSRFGRHGDRDRDRRSESHKNADKRADHK